MKVILMDNIRGTGKVGDMKDVQDGFARNFLFPRELARRATNGSLKDMEQIKSKKLVAYDLAQTEATALAETLKDMVIEITAAAHERGTLFAAIERTQIAEKLSQLAGAKIDPKNISTADPVKTIGDHTVLVELTDEVSVEVKLTVSRT